MQNSHEDLEDTVMDEVSVEHAINIAKVKADPFADKKDGEKVSGSFEGTLYKDENGNAFIYIETVDGEQTEELEPDTDEEVDHKIDEEQGPPEDGAHALHIFLLKQKAKE